MLLTKRIKNMLENKGKNENLAKKIQSFCKYEIQRRTLEFQKSSRNLELSI